LNKVAFACTVGPIKARISPARIRQADVVDGDQAAELLRRGFDLENRLTQPGGDVRRSSGGASRRIGSAVRPLPRAKATDHERQMPSGARLQHDDA
jgi:hypothetical protein